ESEKQRREPSDGATPSDRATEGAARGAAARPADRPAEPAVPNLAGAAAAGAGAAAASAAPPRSPLGAGVTPLGDPAGVKPLGALSGQPPLGLAGGAQALTRPPAPPRPSWERDDDEEDVALLGPAASATVLEDEEAVDTANTWRRP